MSQWKKLFSEWIIRPKQRTRSLSATIFFDFRPVAGNLGLGETHQSSTSMERNSKQENLPELLMRKNAPDESSTSAVSFQRLCSRRSRRNIKN